MHDRVGRNLRDLGLRRGYNIPGPAVERRIAMGGMGNEVPDPERSPTDTITRASGAPGIPRKFALMDSTQDYYRNPRPEMMDFIPESAGVVLEVGCGSGAFASHLKKVRTQAGRPLETWGVEMDDDAARQATVVMDRVLKGDVAAVLPELPAAHFDCLVLNDVIEHVPDPGGLLRSLRPLLKPGGHLVASIPNVRYFFNVVDLAVHGRWDYTDEGILDRTHLRFFTRSSMVRLLEECGYTAVTSSGINPTGSAKFRLVNLLTWGRWSDMKYLQFACLARAGQPVE